MKMIIDANYFQDSRLEDYLKSDINNAVIFNDYACMETYKGNALKNLSKSLRVVSMYPSQVIVLKGTREIIRSTMQEPYGTFHDPEQTNKFHEFCHLIKRAEQGDTFISGQISQRAKEASAHFCKIDYDAKKFAQGIEEFSTSFSSRELKIIRKNDSWDAQLLDKVVKHILLLTVFVFKDHPGVGYHPQYDVLKNSYIFRYSVCAYFLMLRWVSVGGVANVKLSKLASDIVDMGYITYATYYDGLLTAEKKVLDIYDEVLFFLNNIFEPKQALFRI